MTTFLRYSLSTLALLVPAWTVLRATEPEPSPTGHVLLLDNERTLQGDIELVGDRYHLRLDQSETWLPATRVLRLCKDLEEAYQFLRSRTNLEDPDERLRLANWCHVHELPREALEEVQAAARLRPEHEPTRRLLEQLQRPSTPAVVSGPPAPAPVEPIPEPPPVDIGGEALGSFITQIQPILMNTCVGCHGPNHAGSFRLTHVYEGSTASRRATQRNLAAVLAQVNLDRPPASSLLVKAATAHGTAAQPPLRGHQAPAFRALEDWVQATILSNPQLRERPGAQVTALPRTEPKTSPEPAPPSESRPVSSPAPAPGEFAADQGSSPPPPPAASSVTPPVSVEDEHDPNIFNSHMHPERK